MQRALVMTVIGSDRPGLVETISKLVAQHGGNWLESRMSRLGGQFAGIVRVQLPSEEEAPLVKALEALAGHGLKVVASLDAADSLMVQPGTGLHYVLELLGQDRPGIVLHVAQALAALGVNVEDLQTECVSAAMSGETMFKARAELLIPTGTRLDDLRARLEKIAADLIVEITLAEVKPAP